MQTFPCGEITKGRSANSRIAGGQTTTLARGANLEWTNAVADVLALQGQDVPCVFRRRSNNQEFTVTLKVRQLFDGALLVENYADGPFKGTVAAPGVLTQGLCSPWQADYRECGCYYWAASRPDFVNFEAGGASSIAGDNWMQKQRAASGQKRYEFDRPSHEDPNNPPPQWTYEELYRDWEKLKFQIGGADE